MQQDAFSFQKSQVIGLKFVKYLFGCWVQNRLRSGKKWSIKVGRQSAVVKVTEDGYLGLEERNKEEERWIFHVE